MVLHCRHAFLQSCNLLPIPSATSTGIWLVVVWTIIDRWPSKTSVWFIFSLLRHSIHHPKHREYAPHVLYPPHASCPTYKLSLPPTLSWLLGILIDCRPLKAKATPIALFFDGVCVGTPYVGTICGAAKPAGARLAWTHEEPLQHELGVHLAYSGRGQSHCAVGRRRFMLVVAVCLCVVVCDFFR